MVNQEESAIKKTETNSRKNIKIGSILGYLGFFVNILYGLFFTPWIIATIGNSSYGIYTVATTLINLFLIDFGLSTTTTVFLSKYRANHDTDAANRFVSVVFKIYLLVDLAILVSFTAAFFLIDFIYQGFTSEEIATLKGVFLIISIFSLVSFPGTLFTGALNSYEKFVSQKITDISSKIAMLLLTIPALLLNFGVYGLVAVHAFVGIGSIFVRIMLVRTKTPIRLHLKEKISWSIVKPILSFSLFAAIVSFGARFIFTITPTILGAVSNSKEVAVFGVVSTIEGYVYTFGAILAGLFIPKISRIYSSASDPTNELQELAIKIGRIQLFFIALILVGFASCGQEFIFLWMNGDKTYANAYYGILFVTIYQLVFVPQSIFNSALTTKSKGIRALAIFYSVRAVVNSILAAVFGSLFGMLGACLSICITRTLGLLVENFFYHKFLKVNLASFFYRVYLRFLPAIIVSLSLGLFLHFILPLSTFYKFLVIGFSVVIAYVPLSLLGFPKSSVVAALKRFKDFLLFDSPLRLNGAKLSATHAKVRKIFTVLCATSVVVFLGFLSVISSAPIFGIAGTYNCYAIITGEETPVLVESLVVRMNNTCTRTYYYTNGVKNAEDAVFDFRWKMTYAPIESFNTESEVPFKSTTVFSFENEDGGSLDQLYFSKKERKFYAKKTASSYSDAQLTFIRE